MKIGFTGSRNGMSESQKGKVSLLLYASLDIDLSIQEVHHGACVGADLEFVQLVEFWKKTSSSPIIVAHPPIEKTWLSKKALELSEQIREPERFIDRDHSIVDECDFLIATPAQNTEQRRSGTWSTIRYAKKIGRKVEIILP